MTIEKLENDLKNGISNNIYVLYGEETFLIESCLKKIKRNFGELFLGINYIQIDESNLNTLISELQTPAFGYPRKMILVKNSKMFLKETKKRATNDLKEIKEKFLEYLRKNKVEDCILVFVEENIDKTDLTSEIEKQNGVICNFEFQKPAQIEKRLKAICNAYKVNVTSSTINYLIENSGINMQNLINEIRKLIEYAGENGTIKNSDIDIMCTKTIDSTIFDLTDNLGKKNAVDSIQILNDLLYAKEPIQKILITLYNHLKKLYILKIAELKNASATQALGLKPNQTFLVNKYKTQSKYFTTNELKTILKEFVDLDYKYKSGQIDINIGLESIICVYCSTISK